MKLVGFILLLGAFFLDAKENDLEKSFNKASAYFRAGEPKKAISCYKEAYELATPGIKKEVIGYNLGASYLQGELFDEAIEIFESLYEKKEKLPEHLIEKCSYNLIVSYLKKSDVLLDKLASKEDSICVKELLKKASEMYAYFSKITENSEDIELKNDLWLTLKGLNSRCYLKAALFEFESLSFEEGIEKLKERVQDQVFRFEKLAEKEISESMTKYFLSKDYVNEKKSIPIWESVEKSIQKKIEEINSQDQGQNSYELEKLQSFSKNLSESYNEYLSSLDCMKENRLWQGRLRGVRAKLHLELLDAYIKKKDPIEHCLTERVDLKEKQSKTAHNSLFFNSLSKEIKIYSNAAYSLIDEGLKDLKEIKEDFDKSLMISLGDVLKSNLKIGSNFKYDFFLYEEIKKKPEEILYPIYAALFDFEKVNQSSQEQYLFQLKAANKRFDLQRKLDYEKDKKEKIEAAYQDISLAYHSYCEKNYEQCQASLENFLLHWNFKTFMLQKIKEFQKKYRAYHEETVQETLIDELKSDLRKLKIFHEKEKLSDENINNYFDKGIQEILSSIDLSQNESEKDLKKLLIENGDQWTFRMTKIFLQEEQSSINIIESGIKEQKHALKFTETHLKMSDLNEKFDEMAKESEQYPIDAVAFFETALAKELAEDEKQKNDLEKMQHFKRGLEDAKSAKNLLTKETIAWDEVEKKQKNVIWHWQKILEKNQKEKKESSESKKTNQNESSNQSEQNEKITQVQPSEMQEEKNQPSENEKKMMGILERLQEMQQDDKIGKKQVKNTKKGLRPW